MPHLLCLGYGFSARHLAGRLRPPRGWQISGTCREAKKAAALEADGVAPILYGPDTNADAVLEAVAAATHVLVSIPPGSDGDPAFRDLRHAIAARGTSLAWLGYLSTTGVYGNRDGDWVDEESELLPSTERGEARVAAETEWLTLVEAGVPVHLFRLAGIYGPGRNALETVRGGKARRVIKPGQVFSRIHVDDIAQTLEASIAAPNPGRAYNLCDDCPAPPAEVVEFACTLLGVDPPPAVPFEEAAKTMSPMGRSFYSESKRVRNDRIKSELGIALLYPTYEEGLRALMEAPDGT